MKKAFFISLFFLGLGAGLLALVWRTKGLLAAIVGTAGIIIGLLGLFFLKNVLSNYFNAKIMEKEEQQKKN